MPSDFAALARAFPQMSLSCRKATLRPFRTGMQAIAALTRRGLSHMMREGCVSLFEEGQYHERECFSR